MRWLLARTDRAVARAHVMLFGNRPRAVGRGSIGYRYIVADPFIVPARGDVFDFTVHITLGWIATDLTRRQLYRAMRANHARALAAIEHRVKRHARTHSPEQVDELETVIARDFAQDTMCFYWRHHEVRCRPMARVELDPDVRDALRPTLLERLQLETEHDTDMRRADLVDGLSRRWSDLLKQHRENPLMVHAAQMTAGDFAEVVKDMADMRQQDADTLHDLLREAIQDSSNLSIGAYEWAQAYDRLLKGASGSEDVFASSDSGGQDEKNDAL